MDISTSTTPREIVTNILERDISNLYSNLRAKALSTLNNQPLIKKVAENYIVANEQAWLSQIQEKLDLAIEATFINPDISVEDAIQNINELLNTAINQFLEEKLEIQHNTINVALQTLFGMKL